MGLSISDRFWPIVVLRLHDTLTPEDVRAMEAAYEELFRRPGQFVAWSDLRGLQGIPGPAERRLVADWLRRIESEMQAKCLGSCNLVSSPIIRGVMTALYWIFTPPVPQTFLALDEQALAWCRERLEEAGHEPGPVIETFSQWLHRDGTNVDPA